LEGARFVDGHRSRVPLQLVAGLRTSSRVRNGGIGIRIVGHDDIIGRRGARVANRHRIIDRPAGADLLVACELRQLEERLRRRIDRRVVRGGIAVVYGREVGHRAGSGIAVHVYRDGDEQRRIRGNGESVPGNALRGKRSAVRGRHESHLRWKVIGDRCVRRIRAARVGDADGVRDAVVPIYGTPVIRLGDGQVDG